MKVSSKTTKSMSVTELKTFMKDSLCCNIQVSLGARKLR